jgi:hypothetical protein
MQSEGRSIPEIAQLIAWVWLRCCSLAARKKVERTEYLCTSKMEVRYHTADLIKKGGGKEGRRGQRRRRRKRKS